MSTLKDRKEAFVTGLEGGSIMEINIVTSVALTGYFCWNIIRYYSQDGSVSTLVDFCLNWVALLLSITIYSSDAYLLTNLLVLPSIYLFGFNYWSRSSIKSSKTEETQQHKKDPFLLEKKPFLSAYRSGMLIITCLAILAVDFEIFPRRFAKVETWGTSLMDLGVGSFVFSNGVVSARALFKEKLRPSNSKTSAIKKIIGGFRSGVTLLVLGLCRLYFVKNLEYQEHVTEYGVHWNFFITLSLLPPVLVILDPLTAYIPQCIFALSFSLCYEYFMIKDDKFLNYLILSDRSNIFNANREGIVSFIGYCSIFLWGQTIGFFVLGNKKTVNNLYRCSTQVIGEDKNQQRSKWTRLTSVSPITGLFIWFCIFFVTFEIISNIHPNTVSRRFANLPYTIWVATYNTGFLLGYAFVDKMFGNSASNYKLPILLESMNCNGLAMFLLSNVTTGLINMSMSTIDANAYVSISVLLAYAAYLALVSWFLYNRKIFIKL
ncbi:GPI-anchored wall transfer protein 1 [Nakaseomyces bracarensis]|uniref:GPI-anchored wall transfer protein n=1 Tax=Nakaseomyces bracarensis TaxID=273131 RepID=A0ABR4NV42_9SACH